MTMGLAQLHLTRRAKMAGICHNNISQSGASSELHGARHLTNIFLCARRLPRFVLQRACIRRIHRHRAGFHAGGRRRAAMGQAGENLGAAETRREGVNVWRGNLERFGGRRTEVAAAILKERQAYIYYLSFRCHSQALPSARYKTFRHSRPLHAAVLLHFTTIPCAARRALYPRRCRTNISFPSRMGTRTALRWRSQTRRVNIYAPCLPSRHRTLPAYHFHRCGTCAPHATRLPFALRK